MAICIYDARGGLVNGRKGVFWAEDTCEVNRRFWLYPDWWSGFQICDRKFERAGLGFDYAALCSMEND